ncbi:MAG: OB-fold nucleic acid binding domain-containing protein, partial [Desulfuromonadales bacterium]
MTKATQNQSWQYLSTPILQLKGVGPRVAEKFVRLGIRTVEDLLYTLPHRYEDRREFRKVALLRDNMHEVFFGEILACGETTTTRQRRRIFEAVVSDGTGQITLKWFHYRKDWMTRRFIIGRRAVFTGEVKRYGSLREIHHPDVEFLTPDQSLADYQSSDPLAFGRILPVYPLTEGLTQYAARKVWKQAVDQFAGHVSSSLPTHLVEKHRLLPLAEALQQVHWPANESSLEELLNHRSPAHHTLVYDEFFFLELGLALKRQGMILEQGIPFAVTHKYTRLLAADLPYRLTDAQRRVLGEIKQDLMSPHPMNRLIQGDVGCGKTIVALMTALVAIENETQVA